MRRAALDVGTNSFLLIAEGPAETAVGTARRTVGSSAARPAVAPYLEARESPQLGVHADGIPPEGIASACEAASRLSAQAHDWGAQELRIAATEGLRRASNGREVLRALVDAASAVPMRTAALLSGEQEAELTTRAVVGDRAHFEGTVAVIDLGAGSTELALVTRERVDGVSVHVGAWTVTHAEPDAVAALEAAPLAELRAHWLRAGARPTTIFASGGTVTTACALHYDVRPYAPEHVHGRTLTVDDLARLHERVAALDVDARMALGVDRARAGLLPGGLAWLLALLGALDVSVITVSDRGLRHAVVELSAEEWTRILDAALAVERRSKVEGRR